MKLLARCADNLSSYQREVSISKETDFCKSLLHVKPSYSLGICIQQRIGRELPRDKWRRMWEIVVYMLKLIFLNTKFSM